ncbi:MAG: hypothetical protein ACLQNG_01705 [Acidimicrobiales bacterium]
MTKRVRIRVLRRGGVIVVGSMLLTVCLFGISSAGAATTPTIVAFRYVGKAQSWKVPKNVFSATFDVYGAQGSDDGGDGGEATATLTVTPGEKFQVNVGGSNGFNGGGHGGSSSGDAESSGSGGGASDVRKGSFKLDDRVIVGGGGGGGGGGWSYGDTGNPLGSYSSGPGGGGGSAGGAGGSYSATGTVSFTGGVGGAGGTQHSGGAGGAGSCGGVAGGNGAVGVGGNGGGGGKGCGDGEPGEGFGGGGGGGGYFGGGSGGGSGVAGGNGGGGSGYGPSGVVFRNGVQRGNGFVTVSFITGVPASGTLSITPSAGLAGTVINISSVTPCPMSATSPTSVTMTLKSSSTGKVVTSGSPANLDRAGNWNGTLTVPSGTPVGAYAVTAVCSITGVETQEYAYVQFADAPIVVGEG